MKKRIPFLELSRLHRSIEDELVEKFKEVMARAVFAEGEEIKLLEKNVTDFLKSPAAIACSNGTDALELALRALDLRPGDEVIVPALTWISTAEAVANAGAVPVFCDVNDKGLLDPEVIEKHLSPRTACMIPVHLYGNMADMPALMAFARQHGLRVVEDAAQAFGAEWGGTSAGLFGDIGCFSFYPTKNLGAMGEAGLIVTGDEKLEERLRWMLNHGQPERNVHKIKGGNSKMDTLQAGILNVKLRHFQGWQERRKKLAVQYLRELKGINGLSLPGEITEDRHNAHLFSVKLRQRDALRHYLDRQGIGTAIHYPNPLPKTPAFFHAKPFPMAEEISRTTLSLPLHPFLTDEEINFIGGSVREFFERNV